jgi:hypothetical protein
MTTTENIGLYWHFVDIVWIFLWVLKNGISESQRNFRSQKLSRRSLQIVCRGVLTLTFPAGSRNVASQSMPPRS